MKSYVIAAVIVVAAHVALAFLWSPFLGLLVNCGAMVSDGNDVADIPRQWLLGTVIIGMAWIVLANGFMAFVKKAGARLKC